LRLARRDVLVLVRVVVYRRRDAKAGALGRGMRGLAVVVKDRRAKCIWLLKQAFNFCLAFKNDHTHGGVSAKARSSRRPATIINLPRVIYLPSELTPRTCGIFAGLTKDDDLHVKLMKDFSCSQK